MEGPEELIRKASERRRNAAYRPAAAREETSGQEAGPPPAPVSRHSSYTALMRSHDRMRTRHIPDGGD